MIDGSSDPQPVPGFQFFFVCVRHRALPVYIRLLFLLTTKKSKCHFHKKKQKYESTRSAGGQKENAILTYVSSNSATWMRQS